jgi:hypothetical protein
MEVSTVVYELSYRFVALTSLSYQMHDLLVLRVGTRIAREERRSLVECEAGLDEYLLRALGFTFTRRKDEGNLYFDRESGQSGREEPALPRRILTIYVMTN